LPDRSDHLACRPRPAAADQRPAPMAEPRLAREAPTDESASGDEGPGMNPHAAIPSDSAAGTNRSQTMTAVSTRHLCKRFGKHDVLRDISTEVQPGDVVGVIGKNGAGKTTLLETMLGFSPPTSGSVQLFGEDPMAMSAATKARIGFVPQQDELLPTLTGRRQL